LQTSQPGVSRRAAFLYKFGTEALAGQARGTSPEKRPMPRVELAIFAVQ
jgi:hypothetical protein